VPESKGRKKPAYTPPPAPVKVRKRRGWIGPAMATCFLIGIVWLVLFYIADVPFLRGLGNWNLAIGFGLLLVGFGLATRWE
jgi:hypothetical protein